MPDTPPDLVQEPESPQQAAPDAETTDKTDDAPEPGLETPATPGSDAAPEGDSSAAPETESTAAEASSSAHPEAEDAPRPVLYPLENIELQATGEDGRVVDLQVSVFGNGPFVCKFTPASGSTFPIGRTPVKCVATDAYGIESEPGTFIVHITVPPPILTLDGGNPSEKARSESGASVSFNVTAKDYFGKDLQKSYTIDPGSMFAISDTKITCTAIDSYGNSASLDFIAHVTVPPPVLTLDGGDPSEKAESESGAHVSFNVTARDYFGKDLEKAYTINPGSMFAIGDTKVTCTARDSYGNSASLDFIAYVTVPPPVLKLPEKMPTADAQSPDGAPVSFLVTANDFFGKDVAVTYSINPGSMFPIDKTTVTCTARDSYGNSASQGLTVEVTVPPPTLKLPDRKTQEAQSASGAPVSFNATAKDFYGIDLKPTYSKEPGSMFPIDETEVKCTATDSRGKSTSGSFIVKVQDKTPPTLTVPADIKTDVTNANGAVVSFAATAVDLVDPKPRISYSVAPGSTFPIGDTFVECWATDSSGNESAKQKFKITVVDSRSLWLRADLNVVLNGTDVSAWKDARGIDLQADCTSTTYKPTVVSNSANGQPGIKFMKAWLELPNKSVKIGSLFVVAKHNEAYFMLQEGLFSGPDADSSFYFTGKKATSGPVTWMADSTCHLKTRYQNGTRYGTGYMESLQDIQKVAIYSGTDSSLYTCSKLNIGRDRQNSTYTWSGEILEIIVYSVALDDTKRKEVEKYLAARYGINYSG